MSDEPRPDEPDPAGWVSPGRPVPATPAPAPAPPKAAGPPAQPQQIPPQYPPQQQTTAQPPYTAQPTYPQQPYPQQPYPQQPYPAQQPYTAQPPSPPQYPTQQRSPQPYPPQPYPQQPYPHQPYPPQPFYGPGWQAPTGAPTTPVPPGATPAPRRRRRTEIALRVIAAVAAVAVLVGAAFGGRYWLDTRPLGPVTHAMTVHAGRVTTGHCLQSLPQDGTVASIRLVPCDQPHAAEVVGALPLSGATWPGGTAVRDKLVAWCEMDSTQRELGLLPVIWEPTAQGWAQGDRTGLCLAWSPNGPMTGSFVAGDTVSVG